MRKEPSTQSKPLKNALAELVQNLGIGKKLREYDAVTRWEEVVGEQIAKVTKATRIDKGVLVIKVKNSPWRNELTLRKGEIIRKINGSLGSNIVNDIRFV